MKVIIVLAIVLTALFVAALMAATVYTEIKHPCTKEDPELAFQYFIDTGEGVLIPIYGHNCMERKP